MAYYSGTATSITDLLSQLATALTTEGYAQNGNIFSKSTVFVEIRQATKLTSPYTPYDRIEIRMGTGRSGTTLTGGPPDKQMPGYAIFNGKFCFAPARGSTYIPFTFPSTYYVLIHESPNEVYFFLNDDSTRWTYLCFGEGGAIALPGTGNWYAATSYQDNVEDTCGMPNYTRGILFGDNSFQGDLNSAPPHVNSVQHGLDGIDWSLMGSSVGSLSATRWENTPSVSSCKIETEVLWASQPNTWNGQSVLLRIPAYINRGDDKVSLVACTQHSRYVRIDNYNEGDVITLGSDQWKVFPFIRKNTSSRDGVPNTQSVAAAHSGTYGIAIRYDGP